MLAGRINIHLQMENNDEKPSTNTIRFVSLPAKRADQDKEFHNDCFCHQKFHTKPIAALKPAAGIVSCAVR